MANMECVKRHFGAGGKLVPVGTIAEGKADGVYWVETEKTLVVATPSKDKPKTVKELEAEIAVMTDLDALIALSEDERAGVKKAVEARLTELEAGK